MLETFKADKAERNNFGGRFLQRLTAIWYWRPAVPLAGQLALLVLSFACGYLVFSRNDARQGEKMAQLSDQVHDLKQTMMLALLENPSASERIRGVSYTTQIRHADDEVINALLTTLNNDPNVNVRLSTLDALTQLADKPEVRSGLIRSITGQESPLMQSAIADVMLKLQENGRSAHLNHCSNKTASTVASARKSNTRSTV